MIDIGGTLFMGYIDLHVHSSASDGTLTPSQVVQLAVSQKLEAIALTDHDTADGIPEAMDAARGAGLELIPGIELSCEYYGKEIHILGLFIHPDEPAFAAEIRSLLRSAPGAIWKCCAGSRKPASPLLSRICRQGIRIR